MLFCRCNATCFLKRAALNPLVCLALQLPVFYACCAGTFSCPDSKPGLAASQSFSSLHSHSHHHQRFFKQLHWASLQGDGFKGILQSQPKHRGQPQLINPNLFTSNFRWFFLPLIKHLFRDNLISMNLKNTEAALYLLDFTTPEYSFSQYSIYLPFHYQRKKKSSVVAIDTRDTFAELFHIHINALWNVQPPLKFCRRYSSTRERQRPNAT